MPNNDKKVLPKDSSSDLSLPGRYEESNQGYIDVNPVESKPKNRGLWIIGIAFLVFSAGFFLYYIVNQNDIDSRIIQNSFYTSPENRLANQYGVGEYGSDHVHAAIAVFVDGEQVDFGLKRFQLSSKYIHFENHNPYLVHRHATNVPLDMLFTSFGMKITLNCIILSNSGSENNGFGRFCSDQDKTLKFYVNGKKYPTDISQYVIEDNDRILISFGDGKSISKQLEYLNSLKLFGTPKNIPDYDGKNILV